ncbi:uncharacterized protein LOC128733817 isoform X2 [Sabethes cyaneus]|uniref:uncharacterized protein LOC128733817 isoform X2 n=1 Tax=Sabethes cyaneus TaxID=53552 RepID=UPI00237D618E|nr:uncharacterized protein LOC128733817 isoform X2 [Sabethes cyaneus]
MNDLLILVALIIPECKAVPVPRHFGEKNTAFFGVLTCILISAVVGMCVFCKKKKSQFQKFENDGNIEEVKNTEYPILKSLGSLELNKTCAIIPSSPTNLSTDNLLDQTVQYQSESVSSLEHDGIENYNLLRRQNQTTANSLPDEQSENNSGQSNKQLVFVQKDCETSSNMLLSSKESLSFPSVCLARETNFSEDQAIASIKDSADFYNAKSFIEHYSGISASTRTEENNDSCPDDIRVKLPTGLVNTAIILGENHACCEDPLAHVASSEAQEDITPLDSLEDNSSSHETNSIEEALRALDYAITGEHDSADSEDERNFVNYLSGMNEERAAGIDNEFCNEKHSSSDSGMEEAEISDKNASTDVLHEVVRKEASKLVDEILLLCQSRIEEIRKCEENDSIQKIVQDDDFNDFNKHTMLECSTPFVPRKTSDIEIQNSILKQALFSVKNNETYIQGDDDLWQEIENNERQKDECQDYQIFNVTYQADGNIAHVNDDDLQQIYPVRENRQCTVAKIENFWDNSSADDALSDNPTATPMNTPIEPGYPTTADWDEWLSSSTSSVTACRDVQLCERDDFSNQTIDNGWFLHTKSEYDKINEETFNLEENDVIHDSTYDLLRKQLTEILSHAQGAKELSESYEENDAYPNHYGIQYGDLDEASNAPSSSTVKDNEVVINYKRTLSPIIEESEDESFYNKVSFYKESSNHVESTSTGCMESLTAMGMNKTVMASNDTLFNFEDMFDEILSPRVSSQSHTPINRDREIPDYFLRSPRHDVTNELTIDVDPLQIPSGQVISAQRTRDSSLGTTRNPTKLDCFQSSSVILEKKTCVSIGRPTEENERISEISEPVLVSSASCQNKPEENSLLDEEIPSIEEDSFNEILEKEKPLDNEHYIHILDLRGTIDSVLNRNPAERDENFDPATSKTNTGQEVVYLQNKLNLENAYNNRSQEAQVVIESIDRFLLKSRNMSLPDDKSTNSLVNGHLNSCKISSRSDGKNVSINHDK